MTAYIPDIARTEWSSIPLNRTCARWYYNFIFKDQNHNNDWDMVEILRVDTPLISVTTTGKISYSSNLSSQAETRDQPNSRQCEVIYGRR
jgi:hypothetical protein